MKSKYETAIDIEDETGPAADISRGIDAYLKQGKSFPWIARKLEELVGDGGFARELAERGVPEGRLDAIADAIHKGWSGMTVKEHKELKGMGPGERLRDGMTMHELIFSELAESAASERMKLDDAQGFDEVERSCSEGAETAGLAREAYEKVMGVTVVSPENAAETK